MTKKTWIAPTPEELAIKNVNRKFRATTLEAAIRTLSAGEIPFTEEDVMRLANRYAEYIYKGSEQVRQTGPQNQED